MTARVKYSPDATAIHANLPVFDGHNDLPWVIRLAADLDLDGANPLESLPQFHTDISRLRSGGVGAQFWSVYVPSWSEHPLRQTLEQIDLVHRMISRCQDDLEFASTASDVERIRGEGKIASLIGAEGGHSIENSLDNLLMLFERGVRYMTLTHAANIPWADSATDDPANYGLTNFGEKVVREMNRMGMLVDISHVSVATMRDALRVSAAPLIASHSSAFSLAAHPRNIPDDVLKEIGARGGVVMVNFYPGFITNAAAKQALGMFALQRELKQELGDDAAVAAAMDERAKTNPLPRGSVGDVVDHIEHVASLAGVDHVGIGSDFDGIEQTPQGLEDVSTYPAITDAMLKRGWSEIEIRKVLGNNAIAVLAAAESVATG